jgi:two-component system nitrogen regulation sensor histidine kinase NtrY
VRDGDLTVRVPVSGPKDEVYALSQSFNAMTEQLSEQRNALIRAREDEEDRRRFVETLLAEVSAGVIRMDADMTVTLANRSAGELLGHRRRSSPAKRWRVVAPEFERYVRDTLERNSPVDASIEISRNGFHPPHPAEDGAGSGRRLRPHVRRYDPAHQRPAPDGLARCRPPYRP